MGHSPSNLKVRKGKCTDGAAPAADKRKPATGPQANVQAQRSLALADIEPATGGEHSEEEEEDESSSHSPTTGQYSTPVSIVHTRRGDKGKPRTEHRHTPRSPRRLRRVI